MARPKADRTQSVSLRLRMFPEQEQLIRQAAGLAGISISAWIRERLVRAARREVSQAARYEAPGERHPQKGPDESAVIRVVPHGERHCTDE